MANDRISQVPVEVILEPTSAKARVSQAPAEVVLLPTTAKARTSQLVVEVLIGPEAARIVEAPAATVNVSGGAPTAAELVPTVIVLTGGSPTVLMSADAGAEIELSGPPPAALSGWLLHSHPFAIGGLGTLLHEHPFVIENDPITILHSHPFRLFESQLESYVPPTLFCTTLATGVVAGNTVVPLVASAPASLAGMFLDVGGEIVQVEDTFAGGTSVPIVGVFLASHPGGTSVCQATNTAPIFMIFDKAGLYLGTLEDAYVAAAPQHLISQMGNATFYSPRNATNLSLLKGDRLVLIGDPFGEPWAGAIEPQEWAEGREQIMLPDLLSLWDLRVEFDMTVGDDTLASSVYQVVLDTFNVQKRDSGEIEFGSDMTGSRTFNGDLTHSGTFASALDFVAARSSTEYAIRYEVRAIPGGQRLLPFLVVRDRFEVPGGDDLTDGPDATIVGTIRYRKDTSTSRSSILLRGQSTDIRDLVPDWAAWGVHEVEPTVLLSREPFDADQRQRSTEVIPVDWGLSKAESRRLADLTVQTIREMYYSFIYAIHTELGRPWHEGWAYLGPPDEMEHQLHRQRFITDLRLAELKDQPVSLVMRSGPKSAVNLKRRVLVKFNRVTGVQEVVILNDASINTGRRWTTVLQVGVAYDLYGVSGIARASYMATITGAGQTVEVGPILHAVIPIPHTTYRYGGEPRLRGLRVFTRTTKVRSSPYVRTDNVIRTDPAGTYFSVRQATSRGTSVNGSTFWLGNSAGTEWVPLSYTKFIRHNTATNISLRRFMSGPYDDKWVPSDQLGPLTVVPGDSLEFITKVYRFERALISEWDPRQDGIGVWSSKAHVDYAAHSFKPRWHRESWSAGEFTTTLEQGIDGAATTVVVKNNFGAPPPPFKVEIGDENAGSVPETVLVTDADGPQWTVVRAQDGTLAYIHEENEPVVLLDPPSWDGFVFDYEWAAGEAFAEELLDRLNRPSELFDFEAMASVEGVALGSIHPIVITTEGPWGTGLDADVRVIGYARDPVRGTMGLVMEVEP